MVFKKDGSKFWRYRFDFNGVEINKSSKQSNKEVARQMESAPSDTTRKG